MFENDRYVELGVESADPMDDFAHWVTQKERQHADRRLAEIVKQGLVNMEK